MNFSEVIGHDHVKAHLRTTLDKNRVAHAQLFEGFTGSGLLPLAIAYAGELLCEAHEPGSLAYESCLHKVQKLSHPDLHFVYPVATTDQVKKHAVSSSFSEDWRQFVLKNPYGSLLEWFQHLGIENKQGIISVKEAEEISKKLALKSYEGGYKIMIVWMADKMNTECANKILKLVEEPPDKTVLLLLTEDKEQIINTIRSRCQLLNVPLLPEKDIAQVLATKFGIAENDATRLSRRAQGDLNKAIHLFQNDDADGLFESWFVQWVRAAFKAKNNKKTVQELLHWSDSMAGKGREIQKNFLLFCQELFRQALLKNYQTDSLVYYETGDTTFSLDKFAPFVHQNNILEISDALENAVYHIERNGNAKIIFTDLSIQLTRLLHRKS